MFLSPVAPATVRQQCFIKTHIDSDQVIKLNLYAVRRWKLYLILSITGNFKVVYDMCAVKQ